MKIFLTGGTGFIGSNFINLAHGKSIEIICLKRKKSLCRVKLSKEPKWCEGDLSDNWTNELKKSDIFIHLAAEGISNNPSYDRLIDTNISKPTKLLLSAIDSGIKKIIIIGTYWEYGYSAKKYKFIPTDAPLFPTNKYAATKAAFFTISNQIAVEYNIKLHYLRVGQVFGKGESSDRLWPSLNKAASNGDDFHLTSGEQIRDFTPVKFVAQKILECLDFDNINNGCPKITNIGTGKYQTLKEFASFWWNKWDAKGKLYFGSKTYRDDEIIRYVPKID